MLPQQPAGSTIGWLAAMPLHQWSVDASLYLLVAALCLIFALMAMRKALAPIGQLVQAVAAAALVALAIGASLVFLTAAIFAGH